MDPRRNQIFTRPLLLLALTAVFLAWVFPRFQHNFKSSLGEREEMEDELWANVKDALEDSEADLPLRIPLDEIEFEKGSSDLSSEDREKLKGLAAILYMHRMKLIRIEAFTDNVGEVLKNQVLSDERATAIRDVLWEAMEDLDEDEIEEDFLSAAGLGPADPIASNSTSEGRKLNDRVELIILEN